MNWLIIWLFLYLGSSFLHFILIAKTLEEETLLTFHILTLLYLFPLARLNYSFLNLFLNVRYFSVDIYVSDVGWFIRHHYRFYTSIKVSCLFVFCFVVVFDWWERNNSSMFIISIWIDCWLYSSRQIRSSRYFFIFSITFTFFYSNLVTFLSSE